MEKVIWITGMARSGSMWTFNIIRELISSGGYEVLPKHVPETNEEIQRIYTESAFPDQDTKKVYVFKVHADLSPKLPRSYFISTTRDPRDVVMSLMRFKGSDFNQAIADSVYMTKNADHYMTFSKETHHRMIYKNILESPDLAIRQACQKLGLDISDLEISKTIEKYKKSNVKKQIKEVESRYEKNEGSIIAGDNGNVRVLDKVTGFQSGHVSDYKDGDWANMLSPGQLKIMMKRLSPWLQENGYL